MPVLEAQNILDMIESTRKLQGKLGMEQIVSNLTEYPTTEIFLRANKAVRTGLSIKHELIAKGSDAAKEVSLYQEDVYNVVDHMESIEVPWRHANTNYSFDEREDFMNQGMERIVPLIQARRFAAQLALLELTEQRLWEKPTDSTDQLQVFGIPYWVVKNATFGFDGGNAAGFSAGPGGLDSTAFPKWKNHSGTYVNFSDSDLVTKIRRAKRRTKFKTPNNVSQKAMRSVLDRYRIHLNEETLHELETQARANNESLGHDLAKFQDTTTILGVPLQHTPQLDTDSSNPLYMVNYDAFLSFYLNKRFMFERKPERSPKAHNVIVNDIDTSWNLMCLNRRQQTVLSQ